MGYDRSRPYGTPLFAAAQSGHRNVLEVLKESGAAINMRDRYTSFGTALCVAAAHGNADAVTALLQHGADVDASGSLEYGTPLCCAAYNGHARIISLLLKQGAIVNAPVGDCGGALAFAAHHGHVDTVSLLLSHGAKANTTEGHYGGPLGCAAANGRQGIVRILLKRGAFNLRTMLRNRSALEVAANNGHAAVMEILLAHIEAKTGVGPLASASLLGDEHGVCKLMSQDVDLNRSRHVSVLALAVLGRHPRVIELLLDGGARPQSRAEFDNLLFKVSFEGRVKILNLLLKSSERWSRDMPVIPSIFRALRSVIKDVGKHCQTFSMIRMLAERVALFTASKEISEALRLAISL